MDPRKFTNFEMKHKITFTTSKRHKLCGIVSDPSGDKCRPLIVMCHGFTTSKDGRTCVRLEDILNRGAISTFRFDFFGHGESTGDFAKITLSEAMDNVQSAIRFVKDTGYGKVGLMGSSFGGFASILAAGQSNDLFSLALKSPVSDYLGLLIARDQDLDIQSWRNKGYVNIEASDGKDKKLDYSFFADAEKVERCRKSGGRSLDEKDTSAGPYRTRQSG
jgi:pimeloyl-ACP methyl ester carboxylesterase